MSLTNKLAELAKSESFVSVYFGYNNWEKFSFGKLTYVSDEILVLQAYTKYGEVSGYEIRMVSEISKIEIDGKYEQHLTKLIAYVKPKYIGPTVLITDLHDPISQVIKIAFEEKAIVRVWGGDDDQPLTGTVIIFDDEIYQIAMLDDFGDADGIAVAKITDITAIDFEAKDLQVLRKHSVAKHQDQSANSD